jgi:two-component system LytT family response regulator
MKIILIDDEPQAIRALKAMLEILFQEAEVIATASTVEEGIKLLKDYTPDLVFLDIRLPDGDGFEVLNSIQGKKIPVIFATAYDQYALKAFRYSAIDYLLKPINPDLLQEAVQKVIDHKGEYFSSSAMKVLESHIRNPGSRHIMIPCSGEQLVIQTHEIIRFEGAGSYVYIYLVSGQRFMVAKGIGYYDELLEGNGFFRIHQSHMINLQYVVKLTNRTRALVELNDGSKLPIAIRRKKAFKQALAEQKD